MNTMSERVADLIFSYYYFLMSAGVLKCESD